MESNICKCDCKGIHMAHLKLAKDVLRKYNKFDALSDFYKNFADGTRIKILTILDRVGQMCVNDIAVAIDMTKSAISHQLSKLKECNLIKCEKVGKTVFYSLADDHVRDIIEKGIEHLEELGD